MNLSAPPELDDPDHRVRMRAISALLDSRPPQGGQWIRPLLSDREAPVRNAAIVALGALRDQDSLAAVALSCLGVIEALPALQRMALVDDNQEASLGGLWVSNSTIAQRAIERIRSPETTPELAWPDS